MVEHTMDATDWLRKQLEQASPDLLRAMVKEMAEALMSADVDAVCGAGYGERSPERVNRRNGYRERDWDTRVGSIELAVPLQLGVERMSKSRVSRLAKSLDRIVEDFRTRPLDGAPYAYVTLDALVAKCREGGRTVNVCVVHAVGVNGDGFRESLGVDVVTAEDGAAWLAFLRSLVARGLAGVKLVSSDAHPGMRNLLTRVPKSAQSFVATMVRTIFAQPDAATVREQHARIVGQLEDRFPDAAALLDEAGPELLAFTGEPRSRRGVAVAFPTERDTLC